MNRNVLAAATMIALLTSTTSRAGSVDIGATFGGPGLGVGGYIDVQLADSAHLVYGEGSSVDVLAVIALAYDDRYESRYLEYRHVSPEPGNRLEWSAGVARMEREYDEIFSDQSDFVAETRAATLSLGMRTTRVDSAWVWRIGVNALLPFDQSSPPVFEDDAVVRPYFSVALRFGD